MKRIKQTSVILPIAGEGRRFWPLTNKHFLSFLGKPLIYHHLHALQKCGFEDIVLVVNSENKVFAEKLIPAFPKLSFKIVEQIKGQGLGAAILSAQDIISDQVIILSPHDIFAADVFKEVVKKIQAGAQALLVTKKISGYFPGGYVVGEKSRIKEIVEKPPKGKQPSEEIALVFYYFKKAKSLISALKAEPVKGDDQFERAITAMLKKGLKMEAVPLDGFWGYLKYPWDVLNLMEYFLKKLTDKACDRAKIHPTAVIKGPVLMEKNVVVNPHASIIGPCYLGEGTIVGNNSLVRHSHLGKFCVVGYATEVARSYIGDNCWFHSNYVGDSILGKNIAMGAGAITANLRLDETKVSSTVSKHHIHPKEEKISTDKLKLGAVIGDHVRIGVNTSIMPGVKIGRNVVVGAGVVLDKDIKDGKACFLPKECYHLRDNKIDIRKLNRDRSL